MNNIKNKKTLAVIFSIIFLVSSFSNPFLVFSLSFGSDQNDSSSINQLTNNQPQNKLNSEEENIDSFDVNPASGRWETSENGAIDDRIIDSNLRIITSENNTDESSEYFANRGLRDSDGKVESRHKSSFNGSTNDYATSILGDAWDFEGDSTEGFTAFSGTNSITAENGILTTTRTATDNTWGITILNDVLLSTVVYNSMKLRIKSGNSNTNGIALFWFFENGSSDFIRPIESTVVLSTDWTDYTFDLTLFSDWSTAKNIDQLSIFHDTTTSGIIQYEFIQLIGFTDYATNEASISDSWDWEDSLEYFYDVYDNVADWEDGVDDWGCGSCAGTVAVGATENYFKMIDVSYSAGGMGLDPDPPAVSIDSAVYSWVTIEFNSSVNISSITVYDANSDSGNQTCVDSTGWEGNGDFYLFSCNLGLSGNWTGTETGFSIYFDAGEASTVFVNMVYLYDLELGDVEGFSDSNIFSYVNPDGNIHNHVESTAGALLRTPTGLSIDPIFFSLFSIRIKADSDTSRYFRVIAGTGGSGSTTRQLLSTSFQIFTIDFTNVITGTSLDSLALQFFSSSGGGVPIIDSVFTIDYILLTSNETKALEDQSFTMGLWNQDTSQSLVNISQRYFNSSLFRWEIELYDESSEISAYYYSDNQTWVDEYYFLDITYNILETEFEVTVDDQNGEIIFDVNYNKDDFTIINIPTLFEQQLPPNLFFSTFTEFFGVGEIWIDFIKTQFLERQFRQTTTPSDSDWTTDSEFFTELDSSVSAAETSVWRLNLPRLDAISGRMMFNITNDNSITNSWKIISYMRLYTVDSLTGILNEAFEIRLECVDNLPGSNSWGMDAGIFINQVQFLDWEGFGRNGIIGNFNPGVVFSVDMSNRRDELITSLRFMDDLADTSSFFRDLRFNVSVNEISSLASQEFVFEIEYEVNDAIGDNQIFTASTLDFVTVVRDAYADMGYFKDTYGTQSTDIFSSLWNLFIGFLIGIIELLLSALTFLFAPLYIVLNLLLDEVKEIVNVIANIDQVLNTVKTVLDNIYLYLSVTMNALLNAMKTSLNNIYIWLSVTLDAIFVVLNGLLQDILDWLNAFFATLLTWIFNDLWDEFLNLIYSLWEAFWTLILPADLKSFLFGISIDDLNGLITNIVDFANWIIDQLFWAVIALLIVVWTIPMMRGQDPFEALAGVYEQVTNSYETPSIWGFSTGVPVGLILILGIIVFMARGDLPPIFLPF